MRLVLWRVLLHSTSWKALESDSFYVPTYKALVLSRRTGATRRLFLMFICFQHKTLFQGDSLLNGFP